MPSNTRPRSHLALVQPSYGPAIVSDAKLPNVAPAGVGIMDFPTALRLFHASLELAGHAARTRQHYAYELTGFWIWCALQAPPVDDLFGVTSATISAYVTSFDPHGSKRGDALRAIKAFCRWSVDEGYRSADPSALMRTPRPRVNRQAPDIPAGHLVRMLRSAFHREPRRGWNLLLLYSTGSRIGAYCAVRPSDVDLERGLIYFSTTKNDRPYELGLAHKQLVAARHVVGFGHDPIPGVGSAQLRNWLHDAEQDAGLPRMWPHLLRHAFSHRVAANCGGDPELWRIAMNHADLSQWSTYNTRTLDAVTHVIEAV
jgi:site-specific recombinase XerD